MYVVDHPPQVLRLEAVIKFLLEARLERGERRRHRLPRQPADRLKVHPKEAAVEIFFAYHHSKQL